MRLLDERNAAEYLRERDWVRGDERVAVRELAGGVSNEVLYVSRPDAPRGDFVLKQARAQLRTPDPWFCGVERVWREVEALRVCAELLDAASASAGGAAEPTAHIPRILHEDRENYAFAMSAAPESHRVWKADLLAGRAEPAIAAACGRLLGRLHAGSWQDAGIARRLDDRKIFAELRLDPYYRTLARTFPDEAPALDGLIDSVLENRRSLVHADFSPKNLLVYEGGLLLVDFETGHYGDPAFDLGFFLSHLMLKAAYHAPGHGPYLALTQVFWKAYHEELALPIGAEEWRDLERRAVLNFAGCAWARLDGTSKIDYLADAARRDKLRRFFRDLLHDPLADWPAVLAAFREPFQSGFAAFP
ncbi:MAG TPA: phosphotransferase [Pirellulales bacterium]|nr:phosphotransferase [Pirellulales bacterium]